MTDQRNELYRNGRQNAEIPASGKEFFGLEQADYDNKTKHGSFNKLTILNSGVKEYQVRLDGLTAKTWKVPSTGSFEVEPKEGLFFDWVEIINPDAVNVIPAEDLTVTHAISKEI